MHFSPPPVQYHQNIIPCQEAASSLRGVKGETWSAITWSVVQEGTDYNGPYPNIMTIVQMSVRGML